jgi:uncharacterized protein (DUF1778 family)
MPAKGYKKPGARDYMLRVRLTQEERKLYERAAKAAGYDGVSAWLRSIASAVAGAAQPTKD